MGLFFRRRLQSVLGVGSFGVFVGITIPQLIVRCHIGNDVLHMTVHRYKYMHAHESLACVNVFVNKK